MNTFIGRTWKILAAVAGVALLREALQRSRMLDLHQKVVLITGGSRGLGLAMAEEFARAGANLVLCARDTDELNVAHMRVAAAGAQVLSLPCDVSQPAEVQDVVEQALERFGQIDVLVNNAGIISAGNWHTLTREDFEESMNVMFWGIYNTTMAVLPQMRQRKQGRIVNITSIGGKVSIPHLLAYSSAKFAAVGFSEGLHTELAKEGILVTTVAPGLLRSGSQVNVVLKGDKYREEYALFTLIDALPVSSISVKRAARQIVNATRRGKAVLIISIQAQILARLHGAFPNLTASLFSISDRFLPESEGTERHMGHESETALSRSPLTILSQKATEQYNEKAQPDA